MPFNFVQAANRVQCLFGQLAFIRHVQIKKLAASVSHAADFGHAFLEARFIAGKVVAHQLAVPGAEEVTRMLACSAWAEVVNNGFERRKRCGAVGPNIRSVGLLFAWRKHLNRGLIGVDYALGQHSFAQSID
ncbi:hypothetical protein D3C85_1464910 [compost metagenome]